MNAVKTTIRMAALMTIPAAFLVLFGWLIGGATGMVVALILAGVLNFTMRCVGSLQEQAFPCPRSTSYHPNPQTPLRRDEIPPMPLWPQQGGFSGSWMVRSSRPFETGIPCRTLMCAIRKGSLMRVPCCTLCEILL